MQGPDGKLTTSPVPRQTSTMGFDFPQAMQRVIEGSKITRLDWGGNGHYCLLNDGWLMIYRDDKFSRWLVNDGDMMAKDWIVYNEVKKVTD